ncbi:MAG: T9SS type A sorting domain-containing protein [Saprospiraceae bacterium]|nr:T9SS type A sorting domain-containing protein [Saprospiraceae bacterium]
MKTQLLYLILLTSPLSAWGQSPENSPDTLLQHTFEGLLDPADTMLTQPGGADTHWVNYDQDNKTGLCVSTGQTPKGWYWESDLGFINPNQANNDAFTSCSYLQSANPQNRNWLITSPVFVPDDTYWLCWRSLTYYGPDFMDGYKVLASTGGNMPSSFTDTLFKAAQTIDRLVVGSLDLNDYIFSSGYIHANGYTDDEYFFVDFEGANPFYHGKMEPHCVSLSAFAGQTIYLAFLHDSFDDFQLQVDDILVSNQISGTKQVLLESIDFQVMPNPATTSTFLHWSTTESLPATCSLWNLNGQKVWEKSFSPRNEGQYFLEVDHLHAGVYFCSIQTPKGYGIRKLLIR